MSPALTNLAPLAGKRLPTLLAVLLAFACAALAVVWALRLLAAPQPVPADAALVGAISPEQAAAQASRLFGAAPVAASQPTAPSRFRLFGVIAGGAAGSALIGVDGQPPKAVAVGQPVAPGVVLEQTDFKAVWLSRDGQRQELKLDPGAAGGAVGGALGAPPGVMPQPVIAAPAIAPAPFPAPHTAPGNGMPEEAR